VFICTFYEMFHKFTVMRKCKMSEADYWDEWFSIPERRRDMFLCYIYLVSYAILTDCTAMLCFIVLHFSVLYFTVLWAR